MLTITEYDYNHNYRKLNNDSSVFHNALYYVLRGEKRFHIEGSGYDYDPIYEDNDVRAKKDPAGSFKICQRRSADTIIYRTHL